MVDTNLCVSANLNSCDSFLVGVVVDLEKKSVNGRKSNILIGGIELGQTMLIFAIDLSSIWNCWQSEENYESHLSTLITSKFLAIDSQFNENSPLSRPIHSSHLNTPLPFSPPLCPF